MKTTEPETTFDALKYRKDFPILSESVYGRSLIYLDNAATTQKPKAVLDAVQRFYAKENSNIHRGVFCLSEKATQAFENARHKIQTFIHAASTKEVVFVRGATEAINLVAQTYGRQMLKAGDEILITAMEHHANIVPWQILCQAIGAKLSVAPISDHGEILLDEYEKLLTPKTKLATFCHVSNALGTVNPVKVMIEKAHQKNIPVLIDGAQAVAHMPVDVQALDCEFYVFSGHKLFAPTGIGVLYGKQALLEKMPPYQGGGDMISSVTFEKTTYKPLPWKFEAGTPHIAGTIGLGAAVDYLKSVGMERIQRYEKELMDYATKVLSAIPGLKIIGTAKEKAGAISFVLGPAHAHDIGTILDREGIAIRAGHHCAMPVMERFQVPATARASFAFYNTKKDIDALAKALGRVLEVFK